jgi:hypothetical protein
MVAALMLLIVLVSGGWAMVRAWQARSDGTNPVGVARGPLTVVAQNDMGEGETALTVTPGAANSTRLVNVPGAIRNLSALQVLLHSAAQQVHISEVTIGFGDQMGDTDFVDTMRVQLIQDGNANGQRDDADTNLGLGDISDLEEMATITFVLALPLTLPPNSTTALLVLLDINSTGAQAANTRRFPLHHEPRAGWWLALPPMLGLLLFRRFSLGSRRCAAFVLIVVVCWSLTLAGCNGGDDEDLTFVVNLPSNGLSNQGIRLGPPQAIPGVTIRLAEDS